MTTRHYSEEERAFMRLSGIEAVRYDVSRHGERITSEQVKGRIRERTYDRLGLELKSQRVLLHRAGECAPFDENKVSDSEDRVRKASSRRWFNNVLSSAAAIVLIATALGIAARLPAAQAALEKLKFVVPGFGITTTSTQTLILAEPVMIHGRESTLTVSALLSNEEYTEIQFRIDGLPYEKPVSQGKSEQSEKDGVARTIEPDMEQAPVRAMLEIPGHPPLEHVSSFMSAGDGELTGNLIFPPLPQHTRALTLQLSSIHGLTEPFAAPLTLVEASALELTEAAPGGWSVQKSGASVGVPHFASDDRRILLTFDTLLEQKNARVQRFLEPITLTDNLGNDYPLISQDSSLSGDNGYDRGFQGLFAGPVAADAETLTVNVESLQVQEEGEARLRVPLSRFAVGVPVALNETVYVGRWPVVVRTITRLDRDRFVLSIDLGPKREDQFLHYMTILPYRSSGSSSSEWDPEGNNRVVTYELSFTPRGNVLDLEFLRPMVTYRGPWRVELPLRIIRE